MRAGCPEGWMPEDQLIIIITILLLLQLLLLLIIIIMSIITTAITILQIIIMIIIKTGFIGMFRCPLFGAPSVQAMAFAWHAFLHQLIAISVVR